MSPSILSKVSAAVGPFLLPPLGPSLILSTLLISHLSIDPAHAVSQGEQELIYASYAGQPFLIDTSKTVSYSQLDFVVEPNFYPSFLHRQFLELHFPPVSYVLLSSKNAPKWQAEQLLL